MPALDGDVGDYAVFMDDDDMDDEDMGEDDGGGDGE